MVKRNKKSIQGMNLTNNESKTNSTVNKERFNIRQYMNKKTFLVGGVGVLILASGVLATNANAQDLAKTSVNHVTERSLKIRYASDFESKDELVDTKKVNSESKKAMTKITSIQDENTMDDVRQEIERQRSSGLDAYVVQWGDTLQTIAHVIGVSVDDLVIANDLSDRQIIVTGDVLSGVLYQASNETQVVLSTDDDITSISTDLGEPDLSDDLIEDDVSDTESDDNEEIIEDEEANDTSSDDDSDSENVEESNDDEYDDSLVDEDVVVSKGETQVSDDDLDAVDDVTIGSTDDDEILDEDDDVEIDRYVTSESSIYSVDDLAFDVVEVDDPDLEAGQTEIATEGILGKVRYDWTETEYSTGETEQSEKTETVLEEPSDQVVRVGSLDIEKPDDQSSKGKEIHVNYIEYETIRKEVDDLPAGEEVVVVAGQSGVVHQIVEVTRDQSGAIAEKTVVDDEFEGYDQTNDVYVYTTKPVNRVIHVGKENSTVRQLDSFNPTNDKYDYVEEDIIKDDVSFTKHKIKIPAGVDYDAGINDIIRLDHNEELLYSKGVNGVAVVVRKTYYLNDQVVGIVNEDVQFDPAPVNHVIYVGDQSLVEE